jgi:hypothetical protein
VERVVPNAFSGEFPAQRVRDNALHLNYELSQEALIPFVVSGAQSRREFAVNSLA